MPEDKALYQLKLLFENDVNDILEKRFQALFPGLIYVYDSDKKQLQYINNRIKDVLGYSLEDVKSWNDDLMQLVFKEDVEKVKDELAKFLELKDDETYTYQSRLNHKQGNWRYFRTNGTVLRRNAEGKPSSLLFLAEDITDEIRSTEEAKTISNLFTETEHLLNFGSWSCNLGTGEMFWSDGISSLLGYEKGQMKGKPGIEIALTHIDPLDLEQVKQKAIKAIEEKSSFEHTCKLITNHKRELIVSTKASFLEENGTGKLSGITRDITEQVNFQQALVDFRKAANEREIFLRFGSFESQFNPAKITWSDGLYRLFGYDPTQEPKPVITEETYEKHISLKDITAGRRLRESILKENRDEYLWQFEVNGADGKKRLLETYGKIIRDAEGKPERVVGTTRDITIEANSREKIHWYRTLMAEKEEHLNYGTWEYEFDSSKTDFSGGMFRLYEMQVLHNEESNGLEKEFFEEAVAEEDRERVINTFEELKKHGGSQIFDFKIILFDGREKSLQSIAKVITDEDGNKVRMIGTTYDISQLKEYETELKNKIRELDRSNKELEEFAYVASHDMQEPLRKISTFCEILQDRFSQELGDEGVNYIKRMSTASNNMRILIDNLLSFSRLVRSKLTFQATDLNTILTEVKTELELTIAESNTTIRYDKLPVLEVNPTQIKQLFANLVGNAIKFRNPGKDCVIDIQTEKLARQMKQQLGLNVNRSFYRISVSDNGIGFEPEYANKIFQIFQRLHGKSEYPGSGIGLAICKKIVDNHSGIIYATGKPMGGAIFTVILPENQ